MGGYSDVLLQGGSIKVNDLTNLEIDELVKHYKIKNYHGCHIDNELPKKLMNGYYVINLNGQSHWTCLMKDGNKYYYFDSFGFVPSQEVEDQIGEYIYSDQDIQHINSTSCGWFCVIWMKYMQEHKHKNKEICYSSFLKLFSKDSKKNDIVLHNLLFLNVIKVYKILS